MQLPSSMDKAVVLVHERVEAVREWAERTIWWKVWERLLENEFVDRSVALAAKAFVSLFPAIIVVAAFSPHRIQRAILSSITRRAGLSGPGLDTIRSAFATTGDVRRATGVLGLLFTFFYINSFVAALQRVYTKAWRRPAGGRVSGYALGAAWLVAVVAYMSLVGGVRALFGNGPQTLVFAVFALAATMGMWTITPWFMVQRQVRLRCLVPTGVITGIGMGTYAATASLWMPNTVSQNQHQFGFFGVALALVTWLSGAATIIVISACTGPVFAEDNGVFGRLTRGTDAAPVLAPGAKPSLPPPVRALTLSGALGIHRDTDGDDDGD